MRVGAGLLRRVKAWWDSGEGTWRGPFYGQGHLGHWFQLGRLEDGFQRDLRVPRWNLNCIPVIAGLRQLHRSAFAQLRPHHLRESQSAIDDLENSAPLRVMLRPNEYESGADFASRLVDEWMMAGEVAAWGIRNDRAEVAQLHLLPRSCWRLLIDPETQSIFYAINRDGALLRPVDVSVIAPARDVMHLRWATPRHPLIGESGFAAAGLSAGIHVALQESQLAFFAQMRRPSGVLTTEQTLTKDQMNRLREAYDEQSKAMAKGGVPILSNGLKWQPMSLSTEDSEVIAALRMSNEEMARCVGVPGPLVGDLEKAGLANTEALIGHWLSISLGGLIERYEAALERLFDLNGRSEWISMSTEALLRVNSKELMDSLTKGVQGGVLTPNDARRRSGLWLSPIEGGDQAFLQRQNTPVNLLGELAAAELAKASSPQPSAPPASEGAQDEEALEGEEEEEEAEQRAARVAWRLMQAKRKARAA